jgi:hypothetical protein
MEYIIQQDLFGGKGIFDQHDFFENCDVETLGNILSQGVRLAFASLSVEDLTDSDSTKSRVLHERVYRYVRDCVNQSELFHEISFPDNNANNQRLLFCYSDYVFIFKKSGASTNETKVSATIEEQSNSQHILIVEYAVDNMWTEILSVKILYRISGQTMFEYSIPLSDTPYLKQGFNCPEDPTPMVPVLKTSQKILQNGTSK